MLIRQTVIKAETTGIDAFLTDIPAGCLELQIPRLPQDELVSDR